MPETKPTEWLSPDEATTFALQMSRLVHDRCENVPHDIGLDLFEIAMDAIRLVTERSRDQVTKTIRQGQQLKVGDVVVDVVSLDGRRAKVAISGQGTEHVRVVNSPKDCQNTDIT